jgi:hypothetical protein
VIGTLTVVCICEEPVPEFPVTTTIVPLGGTGVGRSRAAAASNRKAEKAEGKKHEQIVSPALVSGNRE